MHFFRANAPTELEASLSIKPPPSSYVNASGWERAQSRPGAILCLRPTGKRGLPLTLLHRVFSHFKWLRLQPLPNSQVGVKALHVALELCSRMGDRFRYEKDRGVAFDEIMRDFLLAMKSSQHLYGNNCDADLDRVYRLNGRLAIIREDKAEMGSAGDAYPQVARSYDLACEDMERNQVTPDAPVFLLSVIGGCS